LILLTSGIIKKELTSIDISLLKNRVQNGNNNDNNNTKNSLLYFSNSNSLKEITLNNEKSKQKALLLISKFYIKIMTIFSAITSVIDPQYVYDDENGNKKFFNKKSTNVT